MRLEAACARALLLGSAAYQTVASILKRRTESLAVSEKADWSLRPNTRICVDRSITNEHKEDIDP